MTLALVRSRITTQVPPAFEKAFGEEGVGLPGCTEPYVIAERLALVAPGTLHTRFYTSAYAEKPGFRPVGPHRFRFPNSHSLLELVQGLHRELSAMRLENKLVPLNLDEQTEFAAVQHILRDGLGSGWFGNQFRPVFYGIFEAMVHHYGAVKITQR